jgi:hypothetical protein
MNDVPEGTVRVHLTSRLGWPPFAEFNLSEDHMVRRMHPLDRGYEGTVAGQAVDVAWILTRVTPEEARETVSEGFWPAEYVAQVEAFRSVGRPPMGVGEFAEVTRASGARSVWQSAGVGWELVEKQSAHAVARMEASRATERQADVEIEAEGRDRDAEQECER